MGTVALDLPIEQALTTTLTRLDVGVGVDIVVVNADADIYVVIGTRYDTAGAVPTPNRYRVPAGICHPIRATGERILLAAVTGTATSWAWAYPPNSRPMPLSMLCP